MLGVQSMTELSAVLPPQVIVVQLNFIWTAFARGSLTVNRAIIGDDRWLLDCRQELGGSD